MKDKEFTDVDVEDFLNISRNYFLRLKFFKDLLKALIILTTFFVFIYVILSGSKNLQDKYFNKSIKEDIQKTIQSNASLDVVKNIYSNRKEYSPSLTDLFNKSSDNDKYLAETPLSEILKDMKTDYYLSEKKDTTYLNKLVSIINSHEIINPFDKLEENQKNDFENLRFKLGENYSRVSADINRITDELHNKNQLVAKYLDKANISFLISIGALAITIILSFYQIYQNSKERLSAILSEVISSRSKENKQEKEDNY